MQVKINLELGGSVASQPQKIFVYNIWEILKHLTVSTVSFMFQSELFIS